MPSTLTASPYPGYLYSETGRSACRRDRSLAGPRPSPMSSAAAPDARTRPACASAAAAERPTSGRPEVCARRAGSRHFGLASYRCSLRRKPRIRSVLGPWSRRRRSRASASSGRAGQQEGRPGVEAGWPPALGHIRVASASSRPNSGHVWWPRGRRPSARPGSRPRVEAGSSGHAARDDALRRLLLL